jgi:hypothetical protein
MLLDQRACAAGGRAARSATDQCEEFPAFHKCPQESKLRAVSCHSGPAIGTAGERPELRPIVLGCERPLRVIFVARPAAQTSGMSAVLPIASEGLHRSATSLSATRRHMQCSKQALLFDHLVGAAEERERDRQAERLGSLEVDIQFDFRCLRTGRSAGVSPLRMRPV